MDKILNPHQRLELLRRFGASLSPYLAMGPIEFDVSFTTVCGPVLVAAVAGRAGFLFREANPVTSGGFLDEWIAAVVLGAGALDIVVSLTPDGVVYFPEDVAYYISMVHPSLFTADGRTAIRAKSSTIARKQLDNTIARADLQNIMITYKLSEQEDIFMAAQTFWINDASTVIWRKMLLPFAEANPGPLLDTIAKYLEQSR